MPVIQRILFPTDFSPAAAAAWPLAQSLAEKSGATLDVVHIMPIVAEDARIPLSVRESVGAAFRAQAEDAYAALTRGTTLPEDRLSLRLLTGVPAAEIVLQAKHLRVDLIVMGTHGYSGVVRWWLGYVAQEVIRTAPCPVLTVKHGQGEDRREREAA